MSSPVAAASTAVQQAFDTATTAYAAQHWSEALAGYTALEARVAPRSRNAAIVRLRRGVALHRLGRNADAAPILADALAGMPTSDASLAIDRYDGQLALAKVDEALFDSAAALSAFAAADAVAPDADTRVAAISGLARLETYLDPQAALATIDRAIALAATAPASKPRDAQLLTIRGRALLNAGKFAAARADLDRAIVLLGGLTLKVGIADLAARSDLAITALLAGDTAGAKKYLAYSAAGTFDDGFGRGADMDPPECGSATGLRPDDVAVVEFGISGDGTVSYATPVYVSRPGPQNVSFSRAAAGWSWPPEKLAKIPALFRAMTRLELRCSTAVERPTMQSGLDAAVTAWFAGRGAVLQTSGLAATDLATARRALGARDGAAPLDRAPFQFAIANNAAAPERDRRAVAAAWSAAVLAASPPPMVRVAAGLEAAAAGTWNRDSGPTPAMVRLLDDPVIAADPVASATLRLWLADLYLQRRNHAAARPLVTGVIGDARLDPHHPLKSAAQLRASAIALADKDVAGARTAFEASGLSEAQCALSEPVPVVTRRQAGERDYPVEALQWNIAGWAVTEFDINADGSTNGVRTTIAYPPFVFGPPTVKIEQRARFTHSFRPGGGPGCSAHHTTINYRIAQRP